MLKVVQFNTITSSSSSKVRVTLVTVVDFPFPHHSNAGQQQRLSCKSLKFPVIGTGQG